ncbi:response regulator transcription factor [Neobacillus sp. WH10]|uniref:response regulator transcription factor n=1 Tax=Neobacillus sp. WH10 TaxID=3047873 RepID=UPI0024C13A5F|nr:response regulator transcription factor [Neobacillus sp. WH10]WHY78102.1 response regulator transcription factor [Neobacillus sp. WH10]
MNKIRIFLVDDHAVVRDGLNLLLNAQSDMIVIGEAAEGNEALLKIPKVNPDVVIMDLSMPNGRDGLPTTSELVQNFPDIKVLILSMHDDPDSLFRALRAGASGFLLKSSLGQELVTAIRQVHSGQAYLYPNAQKRVIEHVFHDTGEEYNDSFDLLSEREKEICSLVAKGYTNKETGELLNISPRTVETHKSKIMEKLKLTTRRDLVQFALKRGLLDN